MTLFYKEFQMTIHQTICARRALSAETARAVVLSEEHVWVNFQIEGEPAKIILEAKRRGIEVHSRRRRPGLTRAERQGAGVGSEECSGPGAEAGRGRRHRGAEMRGRGGSWKDNPAAP